MLVYLAIPIDKSKTDPKSEAKELADDLCGLRSGLVVFSPSNAWTVISNIPTSSAGVLIRTNQLVLSFCDLLLLVYKPGYETWGCPMELYYAHELRKRVIVYEESGCSECLPLYIRGLMTTGRVSYARNMEELLDQLVAATDATEAKGAKPSHGATEQLLD